MSKPGPKPKLSDAQRRDMRNRYLVTRLTLKQLGELYGVGISTTQKIVKGLARKKTQTATLPVGEIRKPLDVADVDAARRMNILSGAIACVNPSCFLRGVLLAYDLGTPPNGERDWLSSHISAVTS